MSHGFCVCVTDFLEIKFYFASPIFYFDFFYLTIK